MSSRLVPGSATSPLKVLAWPAFSNKEANPYNWLLYSHLRELGIDVTEFSAAALVRTRPHIWHIHWPDYVLYRPQRLVALMQSLGLLALVELARRQGTRVVWTIHNLQSHERLHPALEAQLWKRFLKRLDGVFSLSQTALDAARARFPELHSVPAFITPIGHYRGVYPDLVSRAEARDRIGIPPTSRLITYIGHIRPYKNVPHLVQQFRLLRDPDAVLLIAGKPSDAELHAAIEAAAGGDSRVRLALRYIADDELQVVLRAADLVALPFREILNSSSAILALSFNRRVLVPTRGSLSELATRVSGEWVRTYSGPLTAAELEEALKWACRNDGAGRPDLERLSWSKIARDTAEGYRTLLRTPR